MAQDCYRINIEIDDPLVVQALKLLPHGAKSQVFRAVARYLADLVLYDHEKLRTIMALAVSDDVEAMMEMIELKGEQDEHSSA